MQEKTPTKLCPSCHATKSLDKFHMDSRRRRTDGALRVRPICKKCERSKAKKMRDINREWTPVKKCPTCDNAIASHGNGSNIGLRENRARLHSGELLRLAMDLLEARKFWPEQLAIESPLLYSIVRQAECVLSKVMGRRWAENQKKEREEAE